MEGKNVKARVGKQGGNILPLVPKIVEWERGSGFPRALRGKGHSRHSRL